MHSSMHAYQEPSQATAAIISHLMHVWVATKPRAVHAPHSSTHRQFTGGRKFFFLMHARQLVIRGQTASNSAGLHGHEAMGVP
jgi:hypothetical protein